MKVTTKLKIWGFIQLAIGLILMFLGGVVFRDKSWDHFMWYPNPVMFAPGVLIAFTSLWVLIPAYNPQLTKLSAKLQSEVMDYAGEDMGEAISKTADTVIPAITPSIKAAITEVNDKDYEVESKSIEERLVEAKKLFDNHLISADEYQQMRKKILDINE